MKSNCFGTFGNVFYTLAMVEDLDNRIKNIANLHLFFAKIKKILRERK
jgi:hypothetical protein